MATTPPTDAQIDAFTTATGNDTADPIWGMPSRAVRDPGTTYRAYVAGYTDNQGTHQFLQISDPTAEGDQVNTATVRGLFEMYGALNIREYTAGVAAYTPADYAAGAEEQARINDPANWANGT
jgi:hypothetical protein